MKDAEIRALDVGGWPLPVEYLIELGRIASVWAALESFMTVAIAKLAGFHHTDPKPFILVNHASISQKLDMLSALCEQLVAEYDHLADYKRVISQFRSAQGDRNRFLHNGMSPNSSGQMEMAVGSARGSLKTAVDAIDVVDLRRDWVRIHEAQLSLYRLITRQDLSPVWDRRAPEGGQG